MNIRQTARSLYARIDPMIHHIQVDGENFIWTCCGELFYRKALQSTVVRVVLPATCLWCISKGDT